MKSSTFAVLCASWLACIAQAAASPFRSVSGAPYCPPRPASLVQQKQILEEFVQSVYVERNGTKGLLNHMPEDYIQHNPNALSGRENGIESLAFLSPATVNFTIINKGVDGNIGFVHSRLDLVGAPEPMAVVDLFRFEGTCMMEHWDVIQARPANATNPLAMWS